MITQMQVDFRHNGDYPEDKIVDLVIDALEKCGVEFESAYFEGIELTRKEATTLFNALYTSSDMPEVRLIKRLSQDERIVIGLKLALEDGEYEEHDENGVEV